jgi:mono/diheme cytochrome c family protein
MTEFRISLLVMAGIVAIALSTPLEAADGKAVFLEKKCNMCHSIDSQSIQKTSEKMKAPDLSNASTLVESGDWLKDFLTRKVQKDNKNHMREFKGTDEELGAVVDWILTLKTS